MEPARSARLALGLRADGYFADVESHVAVNSGSSDDVLVSPKLSLALGPWADTEVYFNLGTGFHSNDARGTVATLDPGGNPIDPVPPLVRAEGIDIGMRTVAIPGLQTTVTFFGIQLESELIFVGDGGVTEASRPSRRYGVEWTNFYRISRARALDFDLTLPQAEFRDDDPAGNEIPGSVGETVAAGLSWDGAGSWLVRCAGATSATSR